ncbi:MLO-like protein 15 [Rhodamnia argentea]|uniref:MLO-like protein n=1 Tax=Rhodamnia argentea TaxID=178133 RepID=A0ABM3GTS6_9MYRT|nr:MLO-like protein 15 [Rhodamnia argentea]
MADAGRDQTSLEFTPTWVVAVVCSIIVSISLIVDGLFRWAGKRLRKYQWWPLIGASRKIKDEMMLLGIISLLLAVFQTSIGKICISEHLNNVWLPCKKPDSPSTVATGGRRLLAIASDTTDYCSQKGKVPLLSVEAVHHLHIFIFVLATFHVVLCVLKVLTMVCYDIPFTSTINQWGNLQLYEKLLKVNDRLQDLVLTKTVDFYKKPPGIVSSLSTGFQKGFASMTVREYVTLRLNFIEVLHSKNKALDPEDPGKEFQDCIIGTLKKEFENMIGISWYLWLFAVTFLLVNVAGWHALFWISFMPLIIWVIVNIKLEGIVSRLAKDIAEKHTQNEEESNENGAKEMVVEISDDDFWFNKPHLVGNLIHIVLFENSLQLTFFFFILIQYGFHSCIMGKVGFVVPRIVLGAFVQWLCTFRTLPLYAIIKSQKKQSEKQNKTCPDIKKIRMLLKENQSEEERIKECLAVLDDIEVRLKENEMDEDQDMTGISEAIDKRKKPRSAVVPTDTELTRTGSRDGSVGAEPTETMKRNGEDVPVVPVVPVVEKILRSLDKKYHHIGVAIDEFKDSMP